MSASFAGSKHVDERRRRRLASDAGDAPDEPDVSHFLAPQPSERAAADPHVPLRFPLRKLISRKAWKHWLLGVGALATGGALLWIAARSAAGGETAGRHFLRMFDPVHGRVLPVYQSVLLAIGGQLALLIGWTRSRSQEDFHGRYRMWAWCAAGCFAAAGTILTDAHLAFGETVATLWKLSHPQAPLFAWLVPVCISGLIVFRGVRAEMAENRGGSALLHLAAICGLIAAADRLGWLTAGVERLQAESLAPLVDIITHPLFANGTLSAAAVFLLTAMLLHARHVIHVSPEPPAMRRSLLRKAIGAIFRRRSAEPGDEPTGESPGDSKSVTASASADGGDDKSARTKPLIQAASKRRAEAATETSETVRDSQPRRSLWGRLFGRKTSGDTVAPATDTPADEKASPSAGKRPSGKASPASGGNSSRSAAQSGPSSPRWDDDDDGDEDEEYDTRAARRSRKRSRIDRPAPDPEVLKGLSKRERRQVRKQLREQQRATEGIDEE